MSELSADTDGRIRVTVVEEHEIIGRGLAASLAEDRKVDVRLTDEPGVADEDADIVVVSTRAATRHRFPCPVVVCAHDMNAQHGADCNDVAGVLHLESLTVAQLVATVRAAAAGLRVNERSNGDGDGDDAGLAGEVPLEPRALRVLELIADGRSTREIATSMSYSERTIKKLITALEERMNARNRAQVVAQAIRRGLI